jgi:hypothetical protein
VSHEQSETIQDDSGQWINVYGKETPQAGQRLPGTSGYPTVEAAVAAARARSDAHGRGHMDETEKNLIGSVYDIPGAMWRRMAPAGASIMEIIDQLLKAGPKALADRHAPAEAQTPRGAPDPDRWERMPAGALPAPPQAVRRAPVVRTAAPAMSAPPAPQGALSIGGDPWEGAVADSANQNAAMEAAMGGGGPAGAPVQALARRTLADQYRERLGGIKEPEAALSEAQKKKLQMDFFLNLMARSSKPGARFIGAAGEAGLATSAGYDQAMKEARSIAERRTGQQREDAFREIGLADKDEDNQARARQLGIQEDHYKNMDARDAERLKLVQRQIDQGKWQLIPAKGKQGGGTYQLYDRDTGTVKDTGIKIPDAGGGTDNRPDAVKLYEYIKKLPEDEQKKFLATVGKGERHGQPTDTDVFKAAMARVEKDVTGKVTPDQAYREARRIATLSTGGHAAPTSIKRDSKEWKEALNDRRIGGDVKKLEAVLKQAGVEITK